MELNDKHFRCMEVNPGYWRVKIAYVGTLGHLTRDIFRAVFTRKRALNPY